MYPGINIKPSKVGSLHKLLGVAQKKKIPASQLAVKPGDTSAVKKKKVFAKNARSWNHSGRSFNKLMGSQMPRFGKTIDNVIHDKGMYDPNRVSGKKNSQKTHWEAR